MSKKNIPINRVNKFFSGEDFQLEQEFGEEYLSDLNMSIILYRVDRQTTNIDDIYSEVNKENIRYLPPIEIQCVVNFLPPENKTYNNDSGTLRYLQDGQLHATLYQKHLEDLDVEINYGDYVGYVVTENEVRYFSVFDDGKKNYDNQKTILGYKGAFRIIKCAPIDKTEFEAI